MKTTWCSHKIVFAGNCEAMVAPAQNMQQIFGLLHNDEMFPLLQLHFIGFLFFYFFDTSSIICYFS